MTEQTLPLDSKEVPAEIDRWNWGAFLLNWIWGIGNNTFIALLVFVPLLGLVMPFVLGAKGSRWAWRNRHWESIDHFKRVQRAWAKWAVIIYCGVIVLFGAIFGGTFYLLKHSEAYGLAVSKLEASAEVATLLGTPIMTGFPSGKISTNGANGAAALSFAVSGPKGAGRAFAEATKTNGRWSLVSLKLKIDGQDRLIDLLHPTRAEIDGYRKLASFGGAVPLHQMDGM
ncbi:cytochrome c oxidase assembly factor Coa1 family protein [Bradyrhizobium sp.]|uniref:cytochrome c oxidase assembly factor Coa1 family protein n=1 Tax=Bradyrhizobium sp. TaxID=376 RepID=UPI0026047B31|nr:cytochrome c oxidase assembly factor Coa1 family protein [Bradyrhizobium sp.]